MDEPVSQNELEERTVRPEEVWDLLSPDEQAHVVKLLSRMAYKYVLAQRGLLSEEAEEKGEIQSHES